MSIDLALEPLQLKKGKQYKKKVVLSLAAENVAEFLQEQCIVAATVICWQANKVFWAKWDGNNFVMPGDEKLQPKLWLEIRVFNEDMELKLRNNRGQLQGRFIDERNGQAEPCEYVDSLSRLWGEAAGTEDGWMMVEDKSRKLRQQLPEIAEPARFYGLITRNYVGVNERTAQAGYVDYRYVKICSADTEER